MSQLGSTDMPLRVAIVGSGPGAFYAADALLHSKTTVAIAMFDRLPTPYGLVRAGVAPDHPKIKSVIKVFERIAASPAYSFWGNVRVGTDVAVSELRRFFDVLIFAYGAEKDRALNIPGEDLPGSCTATEFVGWYNGHPDYRDRTFDLSTDTAVIIGQGNVALDVCRILAKPVEELAPTDIAAHALETLASSQIRYIHLIGRRGPVQTKFTAAELKELLTIPDCDVVIDPEDMQIDSVSEQELAVPENAHARANIELLRKIGTSHASTGKKQIHIHFLKSPVALLGTNRLEGVRLEKNRLEGEPMKLRAVGVGIYKELPCGILFRSVGYRGTEMPQVPFDRSRGTIPNLKGRIIEEGSPITGLYTCGWIKRGPQGIIGTNKPDAAETVTSILEDLPRLTPCEERSDDALHGVLRQRGVRVVSFDDWRRIDAAEVERGRAAGKPREKFTRIDEMLAVLDGA